MKTEYCVQMENISKRFGGVQALDNVSFRAKYGEIHALVGENGAGKSTLIKILSGAEIPDSGTIKIGGIPQVNLTPSAAIENGISVVYQELMLVPLLTVAENIFIDSLNRDGLLIKWKKLFSESKTTLKRLGFEEIDPKLRVNELSVAYQQVVELSKALSRKSKILILDEPTSVLTINETKKLFEVLAKLRDQGLAIVYISHRLDEIMEICDCVTILKDGRHIDTADIKKYTKKSLINAMVGREISMLFPRRTSDIGDVVMKVEKINAGEMVKDVSFSVKQGEVIGFSGLVGSGRTETFRALFGADKLESGEILLSGEKVSIKSPVQAVKNRIGYVSEDRKQLGVLLDMSILENTTLSSMQKLRKFGLINYAREERFAKETLEKLSTKYGSLIDNVSSLSGGNQQKVSLAKWIAAECICIILDEPTRGVDVGAKAEIYKSINDMAVSGKAVIIISSEMEEIIEMCDKAYVMRHGEVAGILNKDELTEQNLIKLSMGV